MCNLYDMPKEWAEKLAASEAAAFEKALKRAKDMKPIQYIRSDICPAEADDEIEQAYRQGRLDQAEEDNKRISDLEAQICKLRETITRS